MQEFSYLMLLGGLCFFIYGIRLARLGLQELSEDRMRSMIASVTRNRLSALGTGVVMTSVLQSSAASTVMLVGFADAGLITLAQAMGVILGADIGTSITVQLISFHLAEWSLLFVVLGVALGAVFRRSRFSHIGDAVLGFGIVFYGMNLMSQATLPLKTSADFQEFLMLVSKQPILAVLASAIFTAVIYSSSATIGLVLSLAQAGAMTFEVALPLVLGANIGTCSAALVAAAGRETVGRQVAYSHLLFKVLGTLLVFPLLPYFANGVRAFSNLFTLGEASIVRQIANAHTLFNLGISVVFLFFIPLGAKVIEKVIVQVDENGKKEKFRAKFLDPNALGTPSLAQGGVTREIMRLAELVHQMFHSILMLFEKPSPGLFEQVEEEDDRVDYLDKEIRFYLAKLSQSELTPDQAERQAHLLNITTNLEYIGDTINRDLINLARKVDQLGVSFSDAGWEEIKDFHRKVAENFEIALSAFADRNEELARKVIRHERTLGDLEGTLKQNHLARLRAGYRESFDTSSIHLELLSELRHINSMLTHFAYSVTGRDMK